MKRKSSQILGPPKHLNQKVKRIRLTSSFASTNWTIERVNQHVQSNDKIKILDRGNTPQGHGEVLGISKLEINPGGSSILDLKPPEL